MFTPTNLILRTSGNDILDGSNGDDWFDGGGGDDLIFGRLDTDTARYTQNRPNDFAPTIVNANKWDVNISPTETDTVFNVERLQFDDGTFLLDLTTNSGNIEFIYLLYDTLYDRRPDEAGFSFWLDQYNNGMSQTQIYDYFTSSTEYQSTFEPNGNTLSNQSFVEVLFDQALDKTIADDPTGIAFYTGLLNNGVDRSTVALDISQSQEHQSLHDDDYGFQWAWVDTNPQLEWL